MKTLLSIAFALRAAAVFAQQADPSSGTSFNVNVGDHVWVTTADGATKKVLVAGINPAGLELFAHGKRIIMTAADVTKIQKQYRDGIGDGLLRGLGTGALIGALAGGAAALSCHDEPGQFLGGCFPGKGVIFGGLTILGSSIGLVAGGLIDWITPGRKRVYEREHASIDVHPLIGRKAGGAVIGIRW